MAKLFQKAGKGQGRTHCICIGFLVRGNNDFPGLRQLWEYILYGFHEAVRR
jgi:hypothetical protein